jgi:hypothetical protein
LRKRYERLVIKICGEDHGRELVVFSADFDKREEPQGQGPSFKRYSLDDQVTEILERGCDGFIQKPFNMKELSWEIREILEKQ